ncbi:protein mono-ADP-ribosyltransferase PARP14-like [Mytilus trossulus]|uniref:protein mono-ADP-ribosyltransferase PARP14-like n=1 Tax=Mytilus trossulus TaxID=6551 RepID=UPI00300738F4
MNENKEFIQLFCGDITNRKVDVIVNVLGRGWDFRSGTLSTSIIDTAGRGVLTELRYHRSFDKKDVIVTGGGRLFCKKIIHGVLHEWDRRDKNIQALRIFLQTCLGFAESMNMRSVAFPAVGTGFHEFPPDVVAKEMFNEIGTFSRSSLTNIEFVICHRNNHVIKAFEAKMNKYLITRPVFVDKEFLHHIEKENVSPKYSSSELPKSRDVQTDHLVKKFMDTGIIMDKQHDYFPPLSKSTSSNNKETAPGIGRMNVPFAIESAGNIFL